MPYLVQPPAHCIDACNPLFTYTLADPSPSKLRELKDLQSWVWEVSVHLHSDSDHLDAIREMEKAIKKRRRRTQMIYGDMVGNGPRLTLEEVWETEATENSEQELCEINDNEQEVGVDASIVSRMTQQKARVRWADEEAGLEAESLNVVQAADKQSHSSPILRLEDYENPASHVYQGPTGSNSTTIHAYSVPRFIEEDANNRQPLVLHHLTQRTNPRPASQAASSSSTSSASSSSPESSSPLVDPYMLAMATCGPWCPPVFLQAWSRQNPRSQSAAPTTVLPMQCSKEPRKLRKKPTHRNSEPELRDWLPPRVARPLSWVKEKRRMREGGSADAIVPGQQQTEDLQVARRPADTISQQSTFQSSLLTLATTLSDSFSGSLQLTVPTHSIPDLHLQQYPSTFLQPGPRSISPALSTASSLIFPGREITQEEYFQRTNRPRVNLQPRQLTPPPGLETENDPYMWQAWDLGRVRQQNKADRLFGKDNVRPSSSGRASWYDDFRKQMREEQVKAAKEQKRAEKEGRKEKKREEKEEKRWKEREEKEKRKWKESVEKEEKNWKENEAKENLRKQGMFEGMLVIC